MWAYELFMTLIGWQKSWRSFSSKIIHTDLGWFIILRPTTVCSVLSHACGSKSKLMLVLYAKKKINYLWTASLFQISKGCSLHRPTIDSWVPLVHVCTLVAAGRQRKRQSRCCRRKRIQLLHAECRRDSRGDQCTAMIPALLQCCYSAEVLSWSSKPFSPFSTCTD